MRYLTVLLVAMSVLLASCGSDTTTVDVVTTIAPPSTTTTTTVAPATTVEVTTTTLPSSDGGVTVIKDIVYHEMDGHEYLIDVYAPNGEGPWPVVVALHGGTVYKGDSTNTLVAEAAAEAGMVVFAPNWVDRWPAGLIIGDEEMTSWDTALRCAVAFAQQEAARYGGDPNRTIIYGVSAGASSGSGLALHPATEPTPGCSAQTVPVAPVGAVLGDADYFLHYGFFDAGFDADAEGMLSRGAGVIDPASWPADMSTRFRLWVAADGSFPRTFDDPWDEDGWFAQRDPDGTIRADLDELGALDDGVIDYIDQGLLLATRLQQAGIDAIVDTFPGGHTSSDKVPALVAYLLDAAGAP